GEILSPCTNIHSAMVQRSAFMLLVCMAGVIIFCSGCTQPITFPPSAHFTTTPPTMTYAITLGTITSPIIPGTVTAPITPVTQTTMDTPFFPPVTTPSGTDLSCT